MITRRFLLKVAENDRYFHWMYGMTLLYYSSEAAVIRIGLRQFKLVSEVNISHPRIFEAFLFGLRGIPSSNHTVDSSIAAAGVPVINNYRLRPAVSGL